MTFCGVLSLSQVTSITLVCIGPVSVGPIGLGLTQQQHRSSPVGPRFQFHQSVPVQSESKRQSVRFGRSKLVNLGPTGQDQDRTEIEVEHPCCPPDRDRVHNSEGVNGGLRRGELSLIVGGLVDPSWIGRRKRKRVDTETLHEYGTPGPRGEETDVVALRRRKGEKEDGWQRKLPRTLIKVGGS
jgi:hypothetical protein